MDRILERGIRAAEARARAAARALATRMGELLTGAVVEVQGDAIVVTGRGLGRRWLSEPELRFIARGPK